MPRSEYPTEGPHPDLTSTLEQHINAGFEPDLALDLVLNELVVRAAEATSADSAALALSRDDELVCRAATGKFAPDLGVPLKPRDGLSGVCLRTREAQLSIDTEVDPRVALEFSRRFGIRSVLVVPVFDLDKAEFVGVLEVFSSTPGAFSTADQYLLEAFADECARVRQAAIDIGQRQSGDIVSPAPISYVPATAAPEPIAPSRPPRILPATELRPSDVSVHDVSAHEVLPPEFASLGDPSARDSEYEVWTLILGTLAILAIIGVSFVIGSRIGWFRAAAPPPQSSQLPAPNLAPPPTTPAAETKPVETDSARKEPARAKSNRTEAKAASQAKSSDSAPDNGDLVVYEKGKVVFRMKSQSGLVVPPASDQTEPAPTTNELAAPDHSGGVPPAVAGAFRPGAEISAPVLPAKTASSRGIWLNPAEAEDRLVRRVEPTYPAAARRAGNVVLEVDVAEDGSVSSIRTLKGDPVLAAAATEAVRSWRYQPYRLHDRPAQFHTDVTLSFTPSN